MEEAIAFAPCHITGFFEIFDESTDALLVGSKGAGVSINLGAKTTVKIKKGSKYDLKVSINNQIVDFPRISERVVGAFISRLSNTSNFEISVDHRIEAPIGAGFGTSGAAALSLALALNEALQAGMSRIEAAQVAHIAEVECRTGLGTVLAETLGGFEIRVRPGAPGIGEIKRLPLLEDTLVVSHVFGPLSTKEALTNTEIRARINRFGGDLVRELIGAPTIMNFMKLSRRFAEHVGLITEKVRQILIAADKAGIICSMPMFGESAFSVVRKSQLEPLLQIFRESSQSGQDIVGMVDQEGARLLR
jgi:pantoate kinase